MITLKLPLEDVNYILGLLAQQPFGEVYKMVQNIHGQAKDAIDNENSQPTKQEGVNE